MSDPTGIESKLDFLPRLLDGGGGPERFEALLGDLAAAFGWERVGLVWPGSPEPQSRLAVDREGRVVAPNARPAPVQGVRPDEVVTDQADPRRRWALVRPSPERTGLLWAEAESESAGAWSKAEEHLFRLVARMLAASPALRADPDRPGDEMRLRQRLSDAASLAGRMAHDLDNLWTGILGFSDLALAQTPMGPNQQYLVEIAAIGQRGVEMTQQLHQFSRSGAGRPTPTQLGAVVERERHRVAAKHPTAWEVDIPVGLPPVAVDPGALQTLLGQVADNAREAHPAGPVRVSAALRSVGADEAAGYRGTPPAGWYVELTVADHGAGVREDLLPRLFAEPFLTTKVRHRGLGLAIAYRITLAHGGGIRLDSGPKVGTTVRVLLPAAADHPFPERRAP